MLWKMRVFYIAVYGPDKPYISNIHHTECSLTNAPEKISCIRVGSVHSGGEPSCGRGFRVTSAHDQSMYDIIWKKKTQWKRKC